MIDPFIVPLVEKAEQVGYRLLSIDDSGEFPVGCKTARITGPHMPPAGLPFCVPAEDAELWGKRIQGMLGQAFIAGTLRRVNHS